MTADEIIRSVREARQRMVDSWTGMTDEESVRAVNETSRRVMQEIQSASGPSSGGSSSTGE